MKKSIKSLTLMLVSGFVLINFSYCSSKAKGENVTEEKSVVMDAQPVEEENAGVIHLTSETFRDQVFDYVNSKEWNYKGDKPAILDFYADWCRPCKMLAPHLEAIQKEYKGEVQIYKINTDENREVAGAFGIQSLPTIVFVPKEGQPQAVMGYRPQADLESIITEVLKVEKPE
ncbi:thioredoxin [Saccharicrinis sp. FJH54]|uniref:thioredoxin n=1 Tax=Saccharicrinis sp. FJH54 TaxID=3344665 RepID=UPI0035D513EB